MANKLPLKCPHFQGCEGYLNVETKPTSELKRDGMR